jgi:hypothetical protein
VTDPNLRRSIAAAAALVQRRQRKLEEIRRALVAGDEGRALAAMRAFFELPEAPRQASGGPAASLGPAPRVGED